MHFFFWNNTHSSIGKATLGRVVCLREGNNIVDFAHIKGFCKLDDKLCLVVVGSDQVSRKVHLSNVELL